ncbi:MAG TPA: aspartyl protease family protein [Terriglobales bacterium]|nr:aspartyl protease family protein [Terriglobales bacterium]
MKVAACIFPLLLCCVCPAQKRKAIIRDAAPVVVPAAIDHNRVIIDAGLTLPDGSVQRVRAWVDNGNPDLYVSRRVAMLMGLNIKCDGQLCSAGPLREILIGALKIPLEIKSVRVLPAADHAQSALAPGLPAEITIPSIVLRHYDVLIDFPEHKFTIGAPGSIAFLGASSKVQINPENGLIQIPSKIENKKYNFALDLGSSFSFLSAELFDSLATEHPDWPHMTGAVGSANLWGLADESKWKLMRLDRVQFGPLFLTDVAVAALPESDVDFIERPAAGSAEGLLGANVFQNYRVGLDYAHSSVYFDIGRMFLFPDFDVVGVILRPEDDGHFTILDVADFDGKPSVPEGASGVRAGDSLIAVDGIAVHGATMGQVWSMLGGTPGQERILTIERAGSRFAVRAQVQQFLGEIPDEESGSKKKRK